MHNRRLRRFHYSYSAFYNDKIRALVEGLFILLRYFPYCDKYWHSPVYRTTLLCCVSISGVFIQMSRNAV